MPAAPLRARWAEHLAGPVNDALRRLPEWPVYALGALPALWIVGLTVTGAIGVDPVREIEHRLGELGLQFLIASLAVTPLRWIGINALRHRRALGLLAFAYVTLHLAAWVTLDMGLRWAQMAADLVKRPHIIAGVIGLAVMIPLALTSTKAAIRRLGAPNWRRLHRLAYVAGLAGVIHWLLLVKIWTVEPLFYAVLTGVLLGLRLMRAWAPRGQRS